MKKVVKWLKRILIGLLLTAALAPIMMYVLLFISIKCIEWKQDAYDDPVEQALETLAVSEPAKYTTWADLTINGVMTAFAVNPAAFEGTDRWEMTSVTAQEYADLLEAIVPQAAFLLPDDSLIFDAQNVSGSDLMAFYDAQTRLLLFVNPKKLPTPDTTRIDTLAVPTSGWLYEMETHMGLFGDGATYRAFIVPETERSTLEATLAAHADWHAGTITRTEYINLHDNEFYGVPALYPADNVTFDWWCYVDTYARNHPNDVYSYLPDNSNFPAAMHANGARPGGNWLVALYDADTGLFIFYQYDS